MTDLQLHDAIKSTKYNEAVILTVGKNSDDNADSGRREIVLVPLLDIENGGVVWKDAYSSTSSEPREIDAGISRHVRTKKWVIPMLNDDPRNKLYDVSIRKGCETAIEKILVGKGEQNLNEEEKDKLRILDIGSGTGLLAMMAAKHSLEILKEKAATKDRTPIEVDVQSIEMASAMARLACKTIVNNCLQDKVHVTEGHSCDASFLPFTPSLAKANICTSELLESGLLGEGIIPAMRDAWDRHLCEDAIVIPQKARVYAQVIESTWMTNYCGPTSRKDINLSPTSDPSVLLGGDIVVPLHAEALLGCDSEKNSEFNVGMAPSDDDRIKYAKPLSEPTLVLEFDFTTREAIPNQVGRSINKDLVASETGKAHGVLFWWEIDLYGETYSTEVGENWQDHWQQCVFVFRSDDKCHKLTRNQSFTLVSSHDDFSISFKIHTEITQDDQCPLSKRRKKNIDVPRHISYDRALQLNDEKRMTKLFSAIKKALDMKGQESCVLDVSDFSLCSLIAATKFGATNVTSIESSSGDTPMLSAMVSQIGNKLPKENCNFQIINAHLESLCLDHIQGKQPADIIMAEPNYDIMQGWDLACAMNYYYIMKSLKRRGLVKSDAISVPSNASVICCAIEFHPCVVNAHCGLKAENGSICNFKHDDAKLYGENFHTHDMVFPLWQYKWKRLSDNFTVAKITYEGGEKSMSVIGDGEWSKVKFSKPGTCHAIAYWIDYGLRVGLNDDGISIVQNDDYFTTITSGNRFNQQTVRMLPSPIPISKEEVASLHLSIKPSFHDKCGEMEDYSFDIKVHK